MGRQENMAMMEQQISILVHWLHICQAMIQLFCGESQSDYEFKQLLQCWEGGIIDSSNMNHYRHYWSNLFDVLLSTAVSKSISPDRFSILLSKTIATVYQHWNYVYSGANPMFFFHVCSIISTSVSDLQPSRPSGEWQAWLQESDAKLRRVLASKPLPDI